MWPAAKRVVDMGEHGERVGALDQADYLGQVLPDDPGSRALPVQVRRPGEVLAERQAVQRTEHPVKLTGAEQPCDDSACRCGSPGSAR